MTTQTTTCSVPWETYSINWPEVLKKADFIAFDVETNGEDIYEGSKVVLHGFSVAVKVDGTYIGDYFPTGHTKGGNLDEKYWRPLLDILVTKKLIVHNWINEARALDLYGYDPYKIHYYDTMKLAHMQDESFGKTADGYSLEGCCERYLGYRGKQKSPMFQFALKMFGWAGLTFDDIREYGTADSIATYQLFETLQKKFNTEPTAITDYWHKIEEENLTTLSKMRVRGVRVDLDFVKYKEEVGIRRMREIEKETGYTFEGTGSRKSLEKLFWDDLELPQIIDKKTQRPTLNKEAMERYETLLEHSPNKDLAKLILEFRGWQKAVTGFYRPYQEHLGPDGRLRTNYKPHGTVTGRYSSSSPNLQQIPKESNKAWNGDVKRSFLASDGYELWEFDYSQLEFRLAALFSGEPKLLEAFNDPTRDIFSEMSAILGFPRQDCKTLTYSIQYGAGWPRIADVFGVSKGKAQEIIADWYAAYPRIRRASTKAEIEVLKTGKLKLWSGRYRHFKFPKSEARKAFNSINQGGGADIVRLSMNRIDRQVPECPLVLQVHDSCVVEIPEGQSELYIPQIKQIMENPLNQNIVQFRVDAHRMGAA